MNPKIPLRLGHNWRAEKGVTWAIGRIQHQEDKLAVRGMPIP